VVIQHFGLELLESEGGAGGNPSGGEPVQVMETRFHTLMEKEQIVLPVQAASSARLELELLFEIFLEGLRRPLPFLPSLSLPWYKTWLKEVEKEGDERGRAIAREKVRSLFAGDRNYDVRDEAFNLCFQDRLDDKAFWVDFENLAQRLGAIFLGIN